MVKFWEIDGARNTVFFHTKCAAKMGQVSSPKQRVPDDGFMLGSGSDHARAVFVLTEALVTHFSLKS